MKDNIENPKEHYVAPTCCAVSINCENIIAVSGGHTLSVGGKDSDEGCTKTSGYSWGEVRGNAVNWDE